MAVSIEKLKVKARNTPHLESCDRGASDIDRRIYGKPAEGCPRCAIDEQARAWAHKRMFG